jgi:hypothetical protein
VEESRGGRVASVYKKPDGKWMYQTKQGSWMPLDEHQVEKVEKEAYSVEAKKENPSWWKKPAEEMSIVELKEAAALLGGKYAEELEKKTPKAAKAISATEKLSSAPTIKLKKF